MFSGTSALKKRWQLWAVARRNATFCWNCRCFRGRAWARKGSSLLVGDTGANAELFLATQKQSDVPEPKKRRSRRRTLPRGPGLSPISRDVIGLVSRFGSIINTYLSQNGGARVSVNLPSLYSLCLHLRSHMIEWEDVLIHMHASNVQDAQRTFKLNTGRHNNIIKLYTIYNGTNGTNEKYSRTLRHNTKPSPSLRRTFSRRNSRKKKRSCNKMAAPKASVHPVRNRLCYHFFLYRTNESCSRIGFRRLMLLRSLSKSYLRVTAPNATEGWTAILWTFSHCSARNTKKTR